MKKSGPIARIWNISISWLLCLSLRGNGAGETETDCHSIIIHEIVEIRLLQTQTDPFKLSLEDLRQVAIIHHANAIFEEHLYLQEYINRVYQQHFEVATLVRANRGNDIDLEIFLESDVGVFFFEPERVNEAAQILDILREETI